MTLYEKAIKAIDKTISLSKIGDVYVHQDKFPPQEQIQAKIKELEIEETKKQIEQRATNFVKKQLIELDYDNEGEVALYAGNEKSEWHNEAKALQLWIEEVYKKMYELEDSVTADNYETIDLDKIEAEYPAFEFKE